MYKHILKLVGVATVVVMAGCATNSQVDEVGNTASAASSAAEQAGSDAAKALRAAEAAQRTADQALAAARAAQASADAVNQKIDRAFKRSMQK